MTLDEWIEVLRTGHLSAYGERGRSLAPIARMLEIVAQVRTTEDAVMFTLMTAEAIESLEQEND